MRITPKGITMNLIVWPCYSIRADRRPLDDIARGCPIVRMPLVSSPRTGISRSPQIKLNEDKDILKKKKDVMTADGTHRSCPGLPVPLGQDNGYFPTFMFHFDNWRRSSLLGPAETFGFKCLSDLSSDSGTDR